jgi:uncharacterized protein (TIGR03067 family)
VARQRIAVGPGALLETDGGNYRVSVLGKVIQRGTSTNNHFVTPNTSDVQVLEGTHAGEQFKQIYRIDGDVLISCMASPGGVRPTEFRSEVGSGHTLTVWHRDDGDSQIASDTPMKQSLTIAAGIFLCQLAFGIQTHVVGFLGEYGAMAAGILFAGLLIMIFARLLKLGWYEGFQTGLILASMILLFEKLQNVLLAPLGRVAALTVSACAIIGACLLLQGILARFRNSTA